MKKNLGKHLVVAALLTTWVANPFVVLAADVHCDINSGSQTISGTSNIIYDGNGAVVNATGSDTMVTLSGVFDNNQSNAQYQGGGVVYSNGSSIIVNEASEFINNKLNPADTSNPSGMSAGGAIASWGSGSVEIGKDTLFKNNGKNPAGTASWATGGAIYSDTNGNSNATLTIKDGVDFVANTAAKAGAIYAGGTNLTIKDSVTFEGNTTSYSSGGAIYAFGGQVIVDGPSVATVANIGNVQFTDNSATNNGGAIYNYADSKLNFTNGSTFDGNIATENGGAIYNSGFYYNDGAGYTENYKALVNLNNVNFVNNQAKNGGAIYNTIDSSLSPQKPVDGAEIGYGEIAMTGTNIFESNTATNRGGAIYNAGTMTASGNFNYNHAGSYGGAIYNTGDLTIADGSKFVGNTTDYVGGAIAVAANKNASLNIGQNVLFDSNEALYDGGALGNYYSTTVANGVEFVNNKAQTGTSDTQAIGGGAISLGAESKTSISNSKFTGNTSGYDGGAIGTRHSLSADNSGSKLTINDSIFDGNKALGTVTSTQGVGTEFVNIAGGNGGAIANHLYHGFGDEVGVQISGSTFTNNTASLYGGAIYNGGSADVKDNKANIVIDSSIFEGNSATLGGAIYNASQMTLDATDGDILFSKNTDLSGANDIYLAEGSNTDLKGSKNISIGSGISGAVGSVINNIGNLVLAVGSINEKFLGTFNQIAGTTSVNSTFFGGISNISGGKLLLNDGAKIVSGSSVDLSGATVESTGNVLVEGVLSATSGNFNVLDGQLTISGDQSNYKGSFTQSGANTVSVVTNGIFFGGDNNLVKGGKLVIKQDGSISNDITMATGSVLDLDNRTIVYQGDKVVLDGHNILGSIVFENTNLQIDSTAITGDLTISDGTALSSDTGSNIAIDGGSLNLSPEGDSSIAINSNITGTGNISISGSNIGNVEVNSDNSGFRGQYNQSTGSVVVNDGATFFGGDNKVDGDGNLILSEGSLISSDIEIKGDDVTPVENLASIEFSNSIGGVTQEHIANGLFTHDSASASGINNVFVQNAIVVLNNNTIITEIDSATNSLVLNTNTTEDKGVRLLGLANGSGVEGNITLNNGTGIAYGDGAYIKDDSQVKMTDADLIFANEDTNIDYRPVITGSGVISKYGNGSTSISSVLNDQIDINVDGGSLSLTNAETSGIGDVNVTASVDDKSVLTVAAKNIVIGDLDVVGENAQAHFNGVVTGANVVVDNGTLGLYGDSTLDSLVLGSTLTTLDNVNINTVSANSFTLSEDSSFFFDANPRTGITDKIVVGTFTNGNDPISGETAKLIISGIAFTESPIDTNVSFDISNILTANSGDTTDSVVQMQSGGVVANSAMGRYLITSSGSANSLNASLLKLNPQMYRGQVATIASWQNQLVVNNMLFDHMQVVTRQLMDEERTANKYAAAYPQFAPYQYSAKDGNLWYKAYGVFETLSMTRGLRVGNNAYGSLIGADFPLVDLKNGWKLIPTAYVGYNGGHQHFDGVSMYQNGAQLGVMGTAYKGDFLTSLLAYGGGYGNDMTVRGQYGNGSDNTGNWFAGVASKTAYNFHLTKDLIFQPTALVSYNAFGTQNWGSNFGAMSMSTGMLNGINAAPGFNLILQKKSFSLYATAQMVYNIMGGVDGQAGNIDTGYARMKHAYFEYGIGAMKQLKDRFSGYLQVTIRNGGRTGIGFQGGLSWKIGK